MLYETRLHAMKHEHNMGKILGTDTEAEKFSAMDIHRRVWIWALIHGH